MQPGYRGTVATHAHATSNAILNRAFGAAQGLLVSAALVASLSMAGPAHASLGGLPLVRPSCQNHTATLLIFHAHLNDLFERVLDTTCSEPEAYELLDHVTIVCQEDQSKILSAAKADVVSAQLQALERCAAAAHYELPATQPAISELRCVRTLRPTKRSNYLHGT